MKSGRRARLRGKEGIERKMVKEENSDEFYDFSSQGEKRRVRGSRNAKMHRNGQGGDVGVGGCRTTLFGVWRPQGRQPRALAAAMTRMQCPAGVVWGGRGGVGVQHGNKAEGWTGFFPRVTFLPQ